MVVERSTRRCLLCNAQFTGRAFVCRECADRYRHGRIPREVLRRFYEGVDAEYPEWANTYGNYNPPAALLSRLETQDRDVHILEIGAGGGFLLESIAQLGFRNLVGSDITTTALAEMARRTSRFHVVGADAESLPFLNCSFDVVLSSDLIEHLPQVDGHLSEVHRILKPGGRYLLKTPNRRIAAAYYRLRGLYDSHIWHPSMFDPSELRQTLAANGFISRVLAVDALTAAQIRKIPTGIGKHVARKLPVRLLPAVLRPHLEVEARRRE